MSASRRRKPLDGVEVSRAIQARQELASAMVLFLATLDGQTLDEALANAELDARSYGWPRSMVRELGARIRARYARKVSP